MKTNVCFAIHDKDGEYTKYLAVAMYSVLCNTKGIVAFHVICNETLTDNYKEKLYNIVKKFNGEINFYDVSGQKFNLEESQYKRFTIGTLYRLKIFDILPQYMDRVIQLDVDVIVNLDIEELYNVDMEDKCLAACIDRGPSRKSIVENNELLREEYVNVGVVVWDANKIREEKVDLFNESIRFFATHPQVRLPDEEAVNIIFRNRIKYLKSDYNFPAVESRKTESIVERKIYHFCADVPRDFDTYPVDRLFIELINAIDWYSKKNFLLHYINRIREMETKKENVISLFKIINKTQKLVIWGVRGDIHPLIMDIVYRGDKQFIYVDIDERLWGGEYKGEIINPPSILKKGKKDFVIISTVFRYGEVRQALLEDGYEENVDFFDGKQLLKEEDMAKLWGERNNPWDL